MGKIDSKEIFSELEQYSNEREALLGEKLTLGEYFDKVLQNPKIVRSSFQYTLDSITRPEFFASGRYALYGIDKTTSQLIDVLKGGAKGLEIGKRILLLMGPPGGGKTTLVDAIKSGLEDYSMTDEGAMYAIDGCPMHEEPLKLVPESLRTRLLGSLGIKVEGDLCPRCRSEFSDKKYSELKDEKRVRRILLSKSERVGIGTFKPSDPKSQDMTELIGSVDFSKLEKYGSSSDAKAYRFDGELNVANRGVMEFVEMLKVESQFLYALLDLTQSRVIKAPRFADISADVVILAHTNEAEYNNFIKKKENEGLKDRIIIIDVPYNLKVSEEVRIYNKLIGESSLNQVHLAPLALRTAATFAVLSRLSKQGPTEIMTKLRAYDGEFTEELTPEAVKEMQEKIPNEGMNGISPRFVIDCVSKALIKDDEIKCLTPTNILRALREGMSWHTSTRDFSDDDKKSFDNFIATAKTDYDEKAKLEVQKAFVYSFEESAQGLFKNYLDNVRAHCSSRKIKDPVTDEEVPPDEKLMRKIEEQIGITESSKSEFRKEILIKAGDLSQDGRTFDYKSHDKLREALEKTLFTDLKDVVKITTSAKHPDPDQLKKINEVAETLMEKNGYCAVCANDLLKYVGTLLSR